MGEERKTEVELAALLADAATRVKVGGRYQHYKGNFYTVESLALIEATNEPAVIYRAEYNLDLTFIRPISDWLATVTLNGHDLPRFTLVVRDSEH